jgi:hypothetical protein
MPVTDIVQRRIEDAVLTLDSYDRPTMDRYVRTHPKSQRIPVGRFLKPELRDAIQKTLRGETVRDEQYVLSFDALIDYLDALQETGRQHLYIFRIPEGQREVLADPQKVKELLQGDEAIYTGGLRIFETAKGQPELALVKYEPAEAPRYLILKWIETRGDPADGGDEQEEIEDAEEQEATAPEEPLGRRAATFFVADLENGECELRIQDLQTRAMKVRNAEQIRFRGIVEQRLGFPLAGPLPLAPAIRSIILTREVDVLHLMADLPTGGRFIGKRNQFPPADLRRLEKGLRARFAWKQEEPKGTDGSVVLDGRVNEVLILKPLLPEHHRRLVDTVWQWLDEGRVIETLPDEQKGAPGPEPIPPPPPPEPPPPAPPPPVGRRSWNEIVRPVFVRTSADPPPAESKLEEEAHEFKESHGKPSVRALWEFLADMRSVARQERAIYERELERVRIDELWNFRIGLTTTVLGLIVIAVGAYLVFFTNMKTGGISILLGFLFGRGTFLTRQYAKSLKEKRESLQRRQRSIDEMLMAIHATLAIPNRTERTRAIKRLAERLMR